MNSPEKIKPKTAVICMGGGMRSAYSAGFLYAIGTKLKLSPDIIIGTSGSAGNVLYFASGQYESAKHVWCNLIATRHFISFLRLWKILDIDYLIDSIIKKNEPLDTNALAASPIEWFIPVTDAESGETRYLSAQDNVDPFEILRAAKAVPFFFGKSISLLGHKFIDGEIGATIQDHAQFAIAKGATRLVIVNDGGIDSRVMTFLKRILAGFEPLQLRKKMLHDSSLIGHLCIQGPEGTNIVCVFPDKLPAHFATRNLHALKATFERGIEKAVALQQELRTLLS